MLVRGKQASGRSSANWMKNEIQQKKLPVVPYIWWGQGRGIPAF